MKEWVDERMNLTITCINKLIFLNLYTVFWVPCKQSLLLWEREEKKALRICFYLPCIQHALSVAWIQSRGLIFRHRFTVKFFLSTRIQYRFKISKILDEAKHEYSRDFFLPSVKKAPLTGHVLGGLRKYQWENYK